MFFTNYVHATHTENTFSDLLFDLSEAFNLKLSTLSILKHSL